MKATTSGRTPESASAYHELVMSLERFGDVKELAENLFLVDGREILLAAFNSQAYCERKGYYWFSLAKTKYQKLLTWPKDHAWIVLLCGGLSRFFISLGEVEALISRMPPNRHDGRWDLYIRFDKEHAYFGVTHLANHVDATRQLDRFEQIWSNPSIAEIYVDEAVYIPDCLPSADHEITEVVRVVRDTNQSRVVKELYDYRCQVCDWTAFSPRLKNPRYCEAHHVQPLGKRYGGPDHTSNILALCPNHHCMMDLGIMAVEPSTLELVSTTRYENFRREKLLLHKKHGLNRAYLLFHFTQIYVNNVIPKEFSATDGTPSI